MPWNLSCVKRPNSCGDCYNFQDGCLKYNVYGYRAVLSVCAVIKELKNVEPAKIDKINREAEIYFQKCLDLELVFLAKRLIETIDREKINTQPVVNFLKAATRSKTAWLRLLAINTLINLEIKDLTFLKPLLQDEEPFIAEVVKFILDNDLSNPDLRSYAKNFYSCPKRAYENGNKSGDLNDADKIKIEKKGVGELISLLLNSHDDSIRQYVHKKLKKELNSCKQKRDEFLNLVTNQADKLLEEKGEQIADIFSDLIDICLQKMSYPEFYKAWNSETGIINESDKSFSLSGIKSSLSYQVAFWKKFIQMLSNYLKTP